MKKVISLILIICMGLSFVSCDSQKNNTGDKNDPVDASVQFIDVAKGSWYEEPAYWSVSEGIIDAAKPTEFGVNTAVSRKEIILAMWKAAGEPGKVVSAKTIPDSAPDSDLSKAIEWAVSEGIESYTAHTATANDVAKRVDAIDFMWEEHDKPYVTEINDFDDAKGIPSVEWARTEGITVGTGNNMFSPDMNCTKAHLVTFLFRAK